MPNGHDYSKEYGKHDYGKCEGTSDCEYGCGCWMGPARSGGPIGVDPFGECPNNPKDGKRLGGQADHEVVVTRRIRALESKLYNTEQELTELRKIKNTTKAKMAQRIEVLEESLEKRNKLLKEISDRLAKIQ